MKSKTAAKAAFGAVTRIMGCTLAGALFAGACCAQVTGAQTSPPNEVATAWLHHYLPPAPMVQDWVTQSPPVRAARSQRAALAQRSRVTEIGSHEFSVRWSQQQRITSVPAERFAETAVTLERPLRLWGKAGLDAQLAAHARTSADMAYREAVHETTRDLLTGWFELARTGVDRDAASRQRNLSRDLLRQAQVRLTHGDVSVLDEMLARAELQRSESNLAQAEARLASQRAFLAQLFPGLAALPTPGPSLLMATRDPELEALDGLRREFLAVDHALGFQRAESARVRAVAERVQRESRPDPTVGVYAARERRGTEQVVGVTLAIPLGGALRQAQAQAAWSEAEAAADRLVQLEQAQAAQFDARWTRIAKLQQAVVSARAAAEALTAAADKSAQAFALGEHSMTELIQNRRIAAEQQRESHRLQLELIEQQAQLQLDLHRLWDFDD